MGGAGSANAATTNQTSVSTTTVTDSYNQAYSNVENLSDVGNVTLNIGKDVAGGLNPTLLIVFVGIGLAIFLYLKKGK